VVEVIRQEIKGLINPFCNFKHFFNADRCSGGRYCVLVWLHLVTMLRPLVEKGPQLVVASGDKIPKLYAL
jgi:hypothetical protein